MEPRRAGNRMTRPPTPSETFYTVTMRDGTNWLGRSFETREAAAEEAAKIGYGSPWYVTECVVVVE